MPAAAATDRVSGLLRNAQISGQINNTPSSQALVKSESRQLIDQDEVNYKKIAIVSGRSESPTSSMETPSSLKMGPPPTTKITRKQWVAIAILTFVNLINYMDRYTIAGVLPKVKEHYGIGNAEAGALQTIFVSSYMIVAPIFGYLGDRYSRRWLMVIGVSIWVVAVGAGSLAGSSFGLFMFFRALVGIGEASYSTIAPTIISDMFVKEARSKCLAIFYFAIPVGSGLGYVVGQQMMALLGGWEWALRGTPVLGVVAVVLIIFCLEDPPRGAAEGLSEGEEGEATSYSEDLRSLSKNGSFVFSTLAFTCVTFATGALSWWGPDFLTNALKMKEVAVPEIKPDNISFIFGLVTMLAGIFGVILGATLSTMLKRKYARSDPLICGVGLGSCSLLFTIALFHFAEVSVVAALVFIFFGMIAINLNWSIVADILLYVVAPNRRGTAEALQILMSHLLGDAGSPYLIGVVSDRLKSSLDRDVMCGHLRNVTALVDEANNKTRCDVTVEFYSQQYSMGITLFVVALGAAFFFVTAIFVVRDKAACENCSSKNSNNKIIDERDGMLTPRDMEDADSTDEDEPPTLVAVRSNSRSSNGKNILKNKAYSPLGGGNVRDTEAADKNGGIRFHKESDSLLYTEIRNPSETVRKSGSGTPPFARLLDSSADSSLNSSSHSSSNNLVKAQEIEGAPESGTKKSDADVVKDIIISSDFSAKLHQQQQNKKSPQGPSA